jgi:hypothetical protein
MTLCGLERESPDFVKVSLSRFLEAVRTEGQPLAGFTDGTTDVKRLLRLLSIGQRVTEPQ